MKKHYIQDKKIDKWHKEIEALIESNKELHEEAKKLDEKFKKNNLKIQKFKDKITPRLQKEIEENVEMEEFDYVSQIDRDKEGLFANIPNQIEEVKKEIREKRDSSDEDEQEA